MTTYEEFVAIRLNDGFIRARRAVQLVDAIRVATGKTDMPREWLEATSDDEREVAVWHANELLREWRSPSSG